MTQFHQEEQKRFEEMFNEKCGFGIWDSRATDAETGLRTHRDEGLYSSDVLEFAKKFISQSNTRAMKHILEELLAEIPEDEDITTSNDFSANPSDWKISMVQRNGERSRHRASITKKLSDIALEE